MRTLGRLISGLCVLLTVMSCSDDPSSPVIRDTAKAKALWADTRPQTYSFVASRICECLPDAVGPVRVSVSSAATTQSPAVFTVTRVDNGAVVDPGLWFDVDELFRLIDSEITNRPARLDVRYDASRGFPTYVAYGEREVDAGAVIEISDFQTHEISAPHQIPVR